MDFLLNSPFGLWIAATAIIITDSTIFIREGLITGSFSGQRLRLRIVDYPYLLRGREPIITIISYPFRVFFIFMQANDKQSEQDIEKLIEHRLSIVHECRIFSILGAIALLVIIVFGPLLSIFISLALAILFVWTCVYIIGMAALLYIYIRRDKLRLVNRDIYRIIFEIIICPFLVVNIVKKISMIQEVGRLDVGSLIAQDVV